jgi:Zn-dependent oligopeptidase
MALPPAAQLCGATGRSLAAQAATAPQPGAPLKHQQQQQQDAAVTGHAVAQLQRQLEGALRDVEAYQQQHPAVANINKLTKRMRKDLASLSSGGTSSALRFSVRRLCLGAL